MQIVVEVISVGPIQTIPTTGGKSYQCIEIAYKKNGKIEGKKIISFVNPGVFQAVQELKPGDIATVETEKSLPNASGQSFWQWTSITTGGEVATSTPVAAIGATKTVSQYETREERQLRQNYIIKQSSISSAIALFVANGNKKVSANDVITTASLFVDYIYGNYSPEVSKHQNKAGVYTLETDGLDSFPDDIPD